MDIERANRVLKKIAERNATTVEEVIKEIELGINEAIETAIRENNIAVLNEWKKIPCKGDRPTAGELVACLGERLVRDMERTQQFTEEFGSKNFCS